MNANPLCLASGEHHLSVTARFALAAILALCIGAPAVAAKPGGGGGGPSPPPVRYQIAYFTPPAGYTSFNNAWAMNESGEMVGDCFVSGGNGPWSGFLYEPSIDPLAAHDLNNLVHVPEGWWIRYAYGINDRGAFTAAMVKLSAPTPGMPGFEIQGLVVDREEPQVDGKWVPHEIPSPNSGFTVPRDINNSGDVIVLYDQGSFNSSYELGAFVYHTGLYDEEGEFAAEVPVATVWAGVHLTDPMPGAPLLVVGKTSAGLAFSYDVSAESLSTFPALSTYDVPLIEAANSFGEFCGRVRVKKSKGTQTVTRPYRYDPEQDSPLMLLGSETEHSTQVATDVNNSSDAVAPSATVHLFHRAAGTLNLDSLVTGTTQEVTTWINLAWGDSHITERVPVGSGPGFPIIGTTSRDVGAVLLPVAP